MLVKLTRSLLQSNQTKLIIANTLNKKEFHLASLLKSDTQTQTQTENKTDNKTENANNNQSEQKPNEIDLKTLEEKLSKCQVEAADLKDKYLRAMAETENVRIRMRKQVDDAKIFGIQGFCKDLLEVADILNLAIKNTDPNKPKEENEPVSVNVKDQLNSIHQGLVMTETRLLKIFEKHGLVRINPKDGDKFDPNLHEAIFRVPIPNKESGTVEVVSKIGFKLHERVIRAAQVGVVQ